MLRRNVKSTTLTRGLPFFIIYALSGSAGEMENSNTATSDHYSAVDDNGWTFLHHAASFSSTVFLAYILKTCSVDLQSCSVDFQSTSKKLNGPSIYEVASVACKNLLDGVGKKIDFPCQTTFRYGL